MQINIINFSDMEKKSKIISAEYYHPLTIKIDKLFYFGKNVTTLRKLSKSINDFGSFSLYNSIKYLDKEDKNGVPFLRVIDINENSIDYENSQKIDLKSHNLLVKSKVKFNDLIYSIIGTLGVCVVSTEEMLCNSNQSLAKITIDNKQANLFYVCVYLNSKIGRLLALRGESGGLQKHITLQRTRNIPIYLLDTKMQEEIGEMYKKSLNMKKEAINLFKESEEILLKELELSHLNLHNSLTFIVNKKELDEAERIDADYFLPKYKKIIKKIKNYGGGFSKFNQEIDVNDKNFHPKKEVKYKYIALADVSKSGEIISFKEDFGKNLPTRARRLVKEGDIIISSIKGSLNSSTLITKDYESFICSNGFYVLNSKRFNPETLLILFKSDIFIELLKRASKGTILGSYSKKELEKITLPLIRNSIQERISYKIKKANELLLNSKEYLKKSKEILEKEVEKELNSYKNKK